MDKSAQALAEAARLEIARIEPDVNRLLALGNESLRLEEMALLYRDAGNDQPSAQLLSALEARRAEVERQIEPLLPSQTYLAILRHLVSHIETETGSERLAPEVLQRRRQGQRAQLRLRLRPSRRREMLSGVSQATARTRAQMAAKPVQSRVMPTRALRHGPAVTGDGERGQRAPRSIGKLSAEARSQAHLQIPDELPATALREDDDASKGGALASATREMMLTWNMSPIRFSDLYRGFLQPTFPDFFADARSEAARQEAFRYHFSRNAARYGLKYERGTVRCEAVDGSASRDARADLSNHHTA